MILGTISLELAQISYLLPLRTASNFLNLVPYHQRVAEVFGGGYILSVVELAPVNSSVLH